MKLLYVASDQVVPGRTGGSVHVLEVARGLAARGHALHVVTRRAPGQAVRETAGVLTFYRIRWIPPQRLFRFRARAAVQALCAELRPDAVMERYYNFGGEGVVAAARLGIPSLLEVNSPAVDHPGSLKGALDAAALVRPMRRYREGLCRQAAALVAPIPEIVPEFARAKTAIVSWGANVEAFRPGRSQARRRELGVPDGAVVALFSGSFRPWHGVHVFEAAARVLAGRPELYFLLAGGPQAGPGQGYRGARLGSLPYERMPEVVADADIGVAPYDTSRLRQLSLGFYWSPLKLFEYMACGLPSVTIPRAPLTEIVREDREGVFFREGDAADLARAIEALAAAPERRAALGQSARLRVVERYSWARHCEQLEGVLRRIAR